MATRKHWIDNLRGVCMLAILLDHTEVYYSGVNIINYNVYVTDALYLFFFLSGYLMYKQKVDINVMEMLYSLGQLSLFQRHWHMEILMVLGLLCLIYFKVMLLGSSLP